LADGFGRAAKLTGRLQEPSSAMVGSKLVLRYALSRQANHVPGVPFPRRNCGPPKQKQK
jgi:hypothetical protein